MIPSTERGPQNAPSTVILVSASALSCNVGSGFRVQRRADCFVFLCRGRERRAVVGGARRSGGSDAAPHLQMEVQPHVHLQCLPLADSLHGGDGKPFTLPALHRLVPPRRPFEHGHAVGGFKRHPSQKTLPRGHGRSLLLQYCIQPFVSASATDANCETSNSSPRTFACSPLHSRTRSASARESEKDDMRLFAKVFRRIANAEAITR